nr:Arsenate reductase (EC 1.20.4.1) [Kibdelosporangium sp. MJ126-NF4]
MNPACSKCRSAVKMLDEAGSEYTVRRYLEDPPTAKELDDVLTRLGLEPWDVARTQEKIAKELGLSTWPHERDRWIEAMVAHPILIQRPIITADDGTTVVGRSAEEINKIL